MLVRTTERTSHTSSPLELRTAAAGPRQRKFSRLAAFVPSLPPSNPPPVHYSAGSKGGKLGVKMHFYGAAAAGEGFEWSIGRRVNASDALAPSRTTLLAAFCSEATMDRSIDRCQQALIRRCYRCASNEQLAFFLPSHLPANDSP